MKRKILCFVLLVLLVAMMAIPASAAGSATLTVSDATPYRGDTLTVTVNLSGAGAWDAGSLVVTYGSGLELTGVKSQVSDITLSEDLSQGRVIFFSMKGAITVNGKLISLTFKVKNGAAFEANKIDVSLQINGDNIKASKTVTVTCNHKYSAWTASGDKHTRKCSICGKVDSQAHTYDNPCDTDCNDCGASRVTEHSFNTEEWIADETGHWHECVHCEEKSTLEEHVPGAAAGEYTDQTCTVCGIVLTPALGHQHSYDGTYKTDGNFHWAKCLGCGEESQKEVHAYDSDCDDKCDTCGFLRPVAHKLDGGWHCDDNSHWKTCSDCGLNIEQGAHVWDAGNVTLEATAVNPGRILYRCAMCHTERIEEIPALTFAEALPWWMWLLIGGVGGAVIVLIVQGLVLVIKGSKEDRY